MLQEQLIKLAVKKFIEKFDEIRWGWDGDCGSQVLVNDLEETIERIEKERQQ